MAVIAFYFALSWVVGALLIAGLRVKLPWRLPRAVRMVPLALVGAFFFVPVIVNSAFLNVPLPMPALVIDAVTGRTTPLREVLATGDRTSARYRTAGNSRIQMYGNEGKPCPVCKTPIRRITQGTRSTWFCPTCQTRR